MAPTPAAIRDRSGYAAVLVPLLVWACTGCGSADASLLRAIHETLDEPGD